MSENLKEQFLQREKETDPRLLAGLIIAMAHIDPFDKETTKRLLALAGIMLAPKDLKRYPERAYMRAAKSYSSPGVRKKVEILNRDACRKTLDLLAGLSPEEQAEKLKEAEKHPIMLYWLIHYLNLPLAEWFHSTLGENDYFYALGVVAAEYWQAYKSPGLHDRLKDLEKQNSHLQAVLKRVQQESHRVKQELYLTSRRVKEAKKEAFELKDMTDQALEELKKKDDEIAAQAELFQEQIKEQIKQIEALKKKIAQLEEENARLRKIAAPLLEEKPLAGLKICVVGGDTNEPHYVRILRERGAEPVFVSGFAGGSVLDRIASSDAVVQVTPMMKHRLSEQVEAAAGGRIPVFYLNSTGVAAFEHLVKEKLSKLFIIERSA